MELKNWIKINSTDDMIKLAQKCGCHPNYLYQVAWRGCSPRLAKKIEEVTKELTPQAVVTRKELRPDIWDD